MSREIVFIAGSAAPTSRSSYVAQIVASQAKLAGFTTRSFSARDFDPADVLFARVDAPGVQPFVDAVRGASAIVLSSPVYKATYTGGLKAIVDLIPLDLLVDRPALGIATTRSAPHGPLVADAYRALFTFFRARIVDPLVVLDEELRIENGEGTLSPAAKERVGAASAAFLDLLQPGLLQPARPRV